MSDQPELSDLPAAPEVTTSPIEPDAYEQSARIVEAFASDQSDEVLALLREIASAIRDKAFDT